MFPLTEKKISGYTFKAKTWYSIHPHVGIDYKCNNAPLYAPFNGIVVKITKNAWDVGNMIVLRFDYDKTYCRLMHLNSISVKAGDSVIKGQQIGVTGNTGMSAGAHLHLDLVKPDCYNGSFWNDINNFINPELYNWDGEISVPIEEVINQEASKFSPFEINLEPSQVYIPEVVRMQKFLILQGDLEQLPDDNFGYYGKKTQNAINKFQKRFSINASPKYFGWWYDKTREQANKLI